MDLSLFHFINAMNDVSIFSGFNIRVKRFHSSSLQKMMRDGESYLPHMHKNNFAFNQLYLSSLGPESFNKNLQVRADQKHLIKFVLTKIIKQKSEKSSLFW